jgi:hypothetical protein
VPVALFTLRLAKHLHLYHARVRAGLRDTLAAALAGWALMPTAGVAVLMGLIGLRRDFLPTPKLASRHCLRGALAAAGVEGATGAGLLAMAALLSQPAFGPGPDLDLWRLALVVMSVPFVSALGVSLLSALPAPHRMHRAAVQPARAWASRTGDGD